MAPPAIPATNSPETPEDWRIPERSRAVPAVGERAASRTAADLSRFSTATTPRPPAQTNLGPPLVSHSPRHFVLDSYFHPAKVKASIAENPAIHWWISRSKPMKKPITFAAVLDRLIWMIGVMTICNYALNHWRTVYLVVACVLGIGFGIWYFWKFFLLPFRDGLQGR